MTSKLKKWVGGAIASAIGAGAFFLAHPIAFGGALTNVMFADAASLFTALSIMGFTVAPELPSIPAGAFQSLALVFGVIVVVKTAERIWDSLEKRLYG